MMRKSDTAFSSVLVANRGEIALRIMRTARDMGLETIAVYTIADAAAEHVAFADQAVLIGDGPVGDSYLSIEKILDAALQTGAGAIHPGYGFLSENAAFAAAVADAGLEFIGPDPKAISAMGNKAAAKRLMQQASVPCVPGYEGEDQSDTAFIKAAKAIGLPVMIKAAAGGGGRGMRLVDDPDRLKDDLALARAEALAAFGSDELILEQAILRPRHVEVQVFADTHGNVLHLGERDCSVQRRHQKVIEEAPSPAVSPDLRDQMGAAAVEAARAIGYVGAGTVEFLLAESGAFYFLEMNTRLQVEHPVTEMVTGLDLVALQLDAAAGKPLPFTQDDVRLDGHAIEVRLYAEEPTNDFLPSSGDVALLKLPTAASGVRVDAGIRAGQPVSPYYDPMLAKIIAHGATRQEARQKLISALKSTALFGPKTNRDFLIELLEQPGFSDGTATTAFIGETYGSEGPQESVAGFETVAIAGALLFRVMQDQALAQAKTCAPRLAGWGSPGWLKSRMKLRHASEEFVLRFTRHQDGRLVIEGGDRTASVVWQGDVLRLNGQRCHITASLLSGPTFYLAIGGQTLEFELVTTASAQAEGGGGSIAAPMHGNMVEVCVAEGDRVEPGTRLAVLEAMKMQHELAADVFGVVGQVNATAGQQVRAGDLLLEIEVDEG